MLKNEFKKSMYGITVILILFIASYILTIILSKDNMSVRDVQYYKEYINNLKGELTLDKESYIQDEYNRVNLVIEINNELIMNGEKINQDEMQYALEHQNAFSRVYEKYLHLKTLSGDERFFYFDLDVLRFLNNTNLNYFEIFIIVIISLNSVTMDFRDKRDQTIKTTYNGKIKYVLIKQNALFIITSLIAVIFCLIESIYLLSSVDNGILFLPVRSMQNFSNLNINISVGEYVLIRTLYHIIWCMVCSLIMVTIGLLIKKFQTGIFIAFVSIVIPLALRHIIDKDYLIWIYSIHMTKNEALSNYGVFDIINALIMMIIIYTINIYLWVESGKKNSYSN